ncbi:hypothetical protein CPC08DRAFT_711756 [Agrocybe pediades]|nr:hypothetical protein CPC08DRAFT_711756 [Agrocybe pediades]
MEPTLAIPSESPPTPTSSEPQPQSADQLPQPVQQPKPIAPTKVELSRNTSRSEDMVRRAMGGPGRVFSAGGLASISAGCASDSASIALAGETGLGAGGASPTSGSLVEDLLSANVEVSKEMADEQQHPQQSLLKVPSSTSFASLRRHPHLQWMCREFRRQEACERRSLQRSLPLPTSRNTIS